MRVLSLGLLTASSFGAVQKSEAAFFFLQRTSRTLLRIHHHHHKKSLSNHRRFLLSSSMRHRKAASSLRGGGRSGATTASSTPTQLTASFFQNTPMWKSQSIILGTNLLGYIISLFTTTHYHVDLLGTGAFCIAALPSLVLSSSADNNKNGIVVPQQRITWSAAAVATWSVKLAAFLLFRVIQSGGHDNRLNGIIDDPFYSAGFWLYSAMWGILVSLPHTLGLTSSLPGNPVMLRLGAGMFGIGWIVETLADYQKWAFKQTHTGQFCNVGLWSLSQHPNWFGNLLLWTGIFVMNAPALIEPVSSTKTPQTIVSTLWRYRRLFVACLGPLFLYNLFESQASGRLLGDALQATKERYGYGSDPVYTDYVDSTPLIFPKFW